MLPNVFTAIVLIAGLTCRARGALYMQVLFCLFGATSAMDLPSLGGSSINPAVLFMPFMLMRAGGERPSALSFKRPSRAGFFLIMFAAWGALSAALLPRAFGGQTQVLAIDRNSTDVGIVLSWLRPVSGNLTQPVYQIGYACAFVGISALLARRGRLEQFCDAALFLTGLNALAGIINLAEGAGMPPILNYVRTAGYAQFDVAPDQMVRIQGTFSETSWYSTFTLPLFAFSANLWIGRVRSSRSGTLALTSLALLLMSTSGTAYVGLAVYFPILAASLLMKARKNGRIPRLDVLVTAVLIVVIVLGSLFVFETSAGAKLTSFFERTVVNKVDSDSGLERASWNKQAWINFLETYGLGIGLGSARASSIVLALLGNTGVIGTVLYAAFMFSVLKRPRPELTKSHASIVSAAQHAVISAFLCAATSGTTVDMGVVYYAFAAVGCFNPWRQVVHQWAKMAGVATGANALPVSPAR